MRLLMLKFPNPLLLLLHLLLLQLKRLLLQRP
jgi:hypothetical protein